MYVFQICSNDILNDALSAASQVVATETLIFHAWQTLMNFSMFAEIHKFSVLFSPFLAGA
jgi:hypothetical protein